MAAPGGSRRGGGAKGRRQRPGSTAELYSGAGTWRRRHPWAAEAPNRGRRRRLKDGVGLGLNPNRPPSAPGLLFRTTADGPVWAATSRAAPSRARPSRLQTIGQAKPGHNCKQAEPPVGLFGPLHPYNLAFRPQISLFLHFSKYPVMHVYI